MAEPADYGRRLVIGTAVNGAGALIGQVLDLLTVAIAVRRLGGAAYGVIVLAQGWALLPYLFESGLGQQVVRSVAESEDGRVRDSSVLSTAVALYLGLGVVALVAGMAVSPLAVEHVLGIPSQNRAEATMAFSLVISGGAVRLGAGFVQRILVGATRLPALRAAGLLRSSVALGLTLVLVGPGWSEASDVGLALLLAEVVAAAFGVLSVVPRHVRPRLRAVNRQCAVLYGRESRPMLASGAIALFSSRLDPLIIAVALGPTATATYGVVLKVYDVLRSAVELLSLVLMPASARAVSRGESFMVAALFRRALLSIAVVVWPLAVVVALFAQPALRLWAGPEIHGTVLPVVTAMLVVIALAPSVPSFYIISGARRVALVLKVQVGAAAVSFTVGVLLVGELGVGAVFLGSLLGTLIVTHSYVQIVARLADVPATALLTSLTGPAVAVGIAGVLLAMVRVFASGLAAPLLVGGILAIYGVAAGLWLVPREDVRRILPGKS